MNLNLTTEVVIELGRGKVVRYRGSKRSRFGNVNSPSLQTRASEKREINFIDERGISRQLTPFKTLIASSIKSLPLSGVD